MSLSSTMNTAKSILTNTSTQSQVVSKNISNSQTQGYVQRDATTIMNANGDATVVTVRNGDAILQKQMLTANSQSQGQTTLDDGLTQLNALLGGNSYDLSPSSYMTKLVNALQSYEAQPSQTSLAQSAVSAAQDLANSLNTTSQGVQTVRAQADASIKSDVSKLNDLLSQFQTANKAVVQATAAGTDANDALDQRDKIVQDISKIIGVSTVTRGNNDMALYTNNGTVLFDKLPRTVTFTATGGYGAGTTGNPVYIDGVPLKAGTGGNTTAQGSMEANLQIRDDIAPQMQEQLDEQARGLINLFSETPNGSTDDPVPGLFTYADSDGSSPTDPTIVPGIASEITVNTAYVTADNGDPTLLRDGGANGDSYKWNTDGSSSYSTLLDKYVTAFDTSMDFDSSAGLGDSATLTDYASNSIAWLQQYRSTSDSAKESKSALSQRATEAYQNKTGVNLDEELSKMLDIEQSYKASTKLINAVDTMLQSLLEIA
ncbi:flagellar hook-associated protein FlgK [Allorhizobium sp. BGMRC 0089]|uniref:flagellar hook-associated protein FlgK n=1 Tax=Allorhizobium sonneratiae TaxID=2934936 RepID=UPI0020339960|nr:flagellar hook-associated protein FlgK [Allorhizobium sonneratiae]MCM2291380.1 flagellar hook-associated protein FlgK [Allorhizobium sonneratiae]